MAKRTGSRFDKLIAWLLVLFLLFGCIGVLFYLLKIDKDDIVSILKPEFYVEYDGQVFETGTENVITLPESGQARFDVKNCESYIVQILPNVTDETDFIYTVKGEEYRFSDITGLTAAFFESDNIYGNYFIIDCDKDYSLGNVVSSTLGASVTINDSVENPYLLVVTSSDGKKIEIAFGGVYNYIDVTGISLPESIVF